MTDTTPVDTTPPAAVPGLPAGALDPSRLTLGEVADLEARSGLSLDRIGDVDAPKGKLLAAMAHLAARRAGRPLSWEECLALTVPQAAELIGAPDPDAASADPNR